MNSTLLEIIRLAKELADQDFSHGTAEDKVALIEMLARHIDKSL